MDVLNMSELFDPKLVRELFNKVTGKSSIAVLCGQTPVEFTGNKIMVFSMDQEIALVGEGEKRTHGGVNVEPVKIVPLEIEYGARVSARFMTASEEEQLDMLEAFSDGFSKKVARGIDIMAMHGVNPRTGIGQRSDGAILMLVIDGRQVTSLGATYQDMTDIFFSYGAVNACNLDGGSSSMMWYQGDYINNCASVVGIRPVPTTFLVLKDGVSDDG